MNIYDALLNEARQALADSVVVDYIVGRNYIAVTTELGTGLGYVARGSDSPSCSVFTRDFTGVKASEAAELFLSEDLMESAFGLAVINSALNSACASGKDFLNPENLKGKRVAMVGHIAPVAKMIAEYSDAFYVFELNRDKEGTLPPEEAEKIVPDCDMIIFTAVTLINKSIGDYLDFVGNDADKIIMGPSTPMSLELADSFRLAGSRVKDKAGIYSAIQKGFGTMFFKPFTDKVWM
jgi:uncharacterized protein (DUF4213/DUF364 family)